MMKEDLYLTGKILKPKGLKGDLKVLPVTDFSESFLERKSFYVGKTEAEAVCREVRHAAVQNGFVYLSFSDIESREQAEALVGCNVYVSADALIPMPPDRAYLHELRGLKVLDELRKEVGVVNNVLEMPAHEVYEVLHDGRVILVPAIEEFVEEIDIDEGYMVVKRFDEFL